MSNPVPWYTDWFEVDLHDPEMRWSVKVITSDRAFSGESLYKSLLVMISASGELRFNFVDI